MKAFQHYRAGMAALCLLCCLQTIAQPVHKKNNARLFTSGASPFNGFINGSLNINANGAATYTIQPDIPPGTNQFQPSLQFAYNSQSGNGLQGMGYSLSGLASISRTGATVPQDGFRGGVNYDANDRFALNGNRLMVANANGGSGYFTPGAVYYDEMQDWSKVVANGTSGAGPASFTVYLKDGAVAQYGNGNGSQVLAQGPGFNSGSLQGSVRTWLISSVTDPNGNSINYFYTTSPKNLQGIPMTGSATDATSYPDAIYYGANGSTPATRKIQFLYEARTDTLLQYAGGASYRLTARLKAMQAFIINGADTTNVNTYLLNYDASAPLQVSRLLSIVKIGAQGGYTQPLTMQWTNGANGLVGTPVTWGGPVSNAGFEGDFNGDGKTDLVPVSNNTISSIYYAGSAGFTKQPLSSTILTTTTTYVADYNADGLPDILVLKAGISQLYFCNGQGFYAGVPVSGLQFNASGAGIFVADFNGDGMSDLFTTAGSAGYMYLANGNGFKGSQNIQDLSLQSGQTFVADFNGDGQADIYSGGTTGGNVYLSDFSHTGGFQSPVPTGGMTISNTQQNNLIADFNSDGIADILTHTGNQYNLYYSNGRGFDNVVPVNDVNLNITQNWLSDFNGDGTMDFYALAGSTANIYYYYGNKFQSQTNSSPAFINGDTWSGDFNGDGIADLFAANTSTIYYGGNATSSAVPTGNQAPNLVSSINNGINSIINFNYKPITDATVYKPATNNGALLEGMYAQNKYNSVALASSQLNPYPYVHTQSALYVLQQYTVSDGLGNLYPYYYTYAGSLQDIQAYGWLGFQQVVKTDSAAQNIFTSSYLQVYPFTGKAQSVLKTDLSGNRLLQQRNYYQVNVDTLSPLQSYVYQVEENATRTDYCDYGVFAYTTGINYKYDNYGNVITQAQLNDTAETYAIYTLNQYFNDTSGWHIGFNTSSVQAADSLGANLLTQNSYQYSPSTWQVTVKSAWLNTSNSWLTNNYGYDGYGNATLQVNYAGDSTFFTYDSLFHSFPTSQTSPPNQWGARLVNTTVYNPAFGKMASATDANGNTMEVISDQFGRDSIVMGPNGSGQQVVLSQILYYLDSTGYTQQSIIRNDWAGSRWDTSEITYDGLNRDYLHSWRGQSHQLVLQQTSYNSNNSVTWQGLPFFSGQQQQGTVIAYDPYQRTLSVTLPGQNNQQIVNQYSYQGKQVTIHSAVGSADSATSYRNFDYFNGSRKSVQRIDESGLVTTFGYNLLGAKTSVTDPAGLLSTSSYNSVGDILTANNPAAGNKYFIYNYPGKTVAVVNNTGDTITTFFDALKRKISVTTPTGITNFQYDVSGVTNGFSNLCKVILPDTSIYYNYQYDGYHHQTVASLHIAAQNYPESFSFNADQSNNTITYPDNSVAQYTYYDNGYLQQVSMADALGSNANTPYVSYTQYDAAGDQQMVIYGNGVQRNATFNPFGTLNSYNILSAGGQLIANKYYNWNSVNNITNIEDSLNGNNSEYFSYAANGRLDTAQGGYGQLVYGYDAAGNLTTNDSVTLQYNNYQAATALKNGVKVLANIYDSNGNLSQRTTWTGQDSLQTTYNFNVLNQLTSILSGTDTLFTFLYNTNGERLVKKDFTAGITTYYISPQYQLSVTADSVFSTKYVCAPNNFIASVTHGAPVAGGSASAAFTSYLHQNFINSTTYITDTSGNTGSQVLYNPFGTPYYIQGPDTSSYLFGSKELDASGLYYFSSRYYDPITTRFITADNVPGGGTMQTDAFNRYAYTLNNPVKYYDPSGHTLGANIILFVLQGVVDLLTDGAATPELAEMDEALLAGYTADAEKEVGRTFLNALKESRTSEAITDDEAVKIYQAKRDVNLGVSTAERVAANGTQDIYGNTIFKDIHLNNIQSEIASRDAFAQKLNGQIATSEGDLEKMGQSLSKQGFQFKFALSFENYELKIGWDFQDQITHAAVEGLGRDVYTAGGARLEGSNLIIDNYSGHYQPGGNSIKMADPIWRMLKQKGFLNFEQIEYKPLMFQTQ